MYVNNNLSKYVEKVILKWIELDQVQITFDFFVVYFSCHIFDSC